MPNDKYLEERNRARALFAHHLHTAIANLETARYITNAHELGIEVPQDIARCIRDAIDTAAADHQQENPRV